MIDAVNWILSQYPVYSPKHDIRARNCRIIILGLWSSKRKKKTTPNVYNMDSLLLNCIFDSTREYDICHLPICLWYFCIKITLIYTVWIHKHKIWDILVSKWLRWSLPCIFKEKPWYIGTYWCISCCLRSRRRIYIA